MANEQLPSSNSPTLVSEPTSAVQTESESSDGSSSSDDADDDKSSPEQSPAESEQSADEQERSDANDDDDASNDSDDSESKGDATIVDGDKVQHDSSNSIVDIDASGGVGDVRQPTEQLTPAATAQADLDDKIRYRNLKVIYGGRDILDLSGNLANKSWHTQYAYLPEINFKMLMDNRSQYNRLSSGYHENPNHDYILSKCGSCTFQYPVVITEKNDQPSAAATEPLSKLLEETTSSLMRRLTPVPNMNVTAQRTSATPANIDSTLALLQGSNMHAMNNNFMMNNRSQMMTYQNNYKPITKNADVLASAAAAAAAALPTTTSTLATRRISTAQTHFTGTGIIPTMRQHSTH